MNVEPREMVVLCGGRGTRLGSKTMEIPKPLLSIGGHPFLLRLLLYWKQQGVGRFILSAGYLADQIETFAMESREKVGEILVVREPEPLGTGGGLRWAVKQTGQSTVCVTNGDSVVLQALTPLWEEHKKLQNDFTIVGVHPNRVLGGARQKGRMLVKESALMGFTTEDSVDEGWVNGGVYVVQREEILRWPEGRYDLEQAILPQVEKRRTGVLKSDALLLDIGIPECFDMIDAQAGPLDRLFTQIQLPDAPTSS